VGPVVGIVVAGGAGTRFGALKQFATLHGRAVAERAVDACRSVADRVVLVVPAGHDGPAFGADAVVVGGQTRSASVRAGLAAAGQAEVVVVHDAARPLARPELFAAVVAAVQAGAAGAVCAVEVTDTVKRVVAGEAGELTVIETLDRRSLVAVQTPQAFRLDALRRAHAGEPEATDDAALVEAIGLAVRVVPGDPENLKLTTPADLVRAERLAVP
jgi:2-C-methyl-D-erythritol 4-phosphate cytidylyltransferase